MSLLSIRANSRCASFNTTVWLTRLCCYSSHFITAEKMKGGTDRRVTIQREDGAFIWEYDVPMYLRVALPAKAVWKDVVEIK